MVYLLDPVRVAFRVPRHADAEVVAIVLADVLHLDGRGKEIGERGGGTNPRAPARAQNARMKKTTKTAVLGLG